MNFHIEVFKIAWRNIVFIQSRVLYMKKTFKKYFLYGTKKTFKINEMP